MIAGGVRDRTASGSGVYMSFSGLRIRTRGQRGSPTTWFNRNKKIQTATNKKHAPRRPNLLPTRRLQPNKIVIFVDDGRLTVRRYVGFESHHLILSRLKYNSPLKSRLVEMGRCTGSNEMKLESGYNRMAFRNRRLPIILVLL